MNKRSGIVTVCILWLLIGSVGKDAVGQRNEPAAPRVLFIGDSTLSYYSSSLREGLAGEVDVHLIPCNGGPTTNGVANVDSWLGKGRWDAIHFNFGLHDVAMTDGKQRVPIDEYERNLRKVVECLKRTNAKLIWASTTPVTGTNRRNEDVIAYNAVAEKIMKENGIVVNDLYALVLPRVPAIQISDGVHFDKEGAGLLGRQVAAVVLKVLEKPAAAQAETAKPSAAVPRRTVFREGFEATGRLEAWAHNGDFTINFAGPTSEKAASGKRSYKIDVTWKKGTYNYWRSRLLMIPFCGNPEVRASLHVARGKADLSYGWTDPRAQLTGQVTRGKEVGKPADTWRRWSASVAGRPEDGQHIVSVVVCLQPDQDGRSVVYVDDLEVEAALGPNYESQTKAWIRRIPVRRKAQADSLRSRLRGLTRLTDAMPAALSASVSPLLQDFWRKGKEECRQGQAAIDALITELQTSATDEKIATVQNLQTTAETLQRSVASLVNRATAYPQWPLLVLIAEPIGNQHILSQKFPVAAKPGTQLRVSACRGEYEPASFALYATKNAELREVSAEPSEAKCGRFTIPVSAIDIRVVKCWWQTGTKINDMTHPVLVPELLLKDGGMVVVDDAKRRNSLRDPQAPRDAQQLVPVTIPAGSTQQFWITVHVPDDAQPGIYQGSIAIRAADLQPVTLPMKIEVLPFRLKAPRLEYSIYYRGYLTADGKGSIGSESKSPAQYLAEMRDMKAHGVDYPTCYQRRGKLLDQAIAIRHEAGIAIDPFYSLGLCTGKPDTPAELTALKERTRAFVADVAKHGVKQLYIYGIDEAKPDVLQLERAAFQTVHEAGAKLFVACNADAVDVVGDLLDLPIAAGKLQPNRAEQWHAHGQRIFSYSNPQVGVEEPETYRRNFGLALWKAGYDGTTDYAYQHGFGPDIWNDFDDKQYRDHVFAYPTVDGVIDTIEWEGFREGVDDVRYLGALLDAIEQAKADPAKKQAAADAEQWVRTMDIEGDLNAVRQRMVREIIALAK